MNFEELANAKLTGEEKSEFAVEDLDAQVNDIIEKVAFTRDEKFERLPITFIGIDSDLDFCFIEGNGNVLPALVITDEMYDKGTGETKKVRVVMPIGQDDVRKLFALIQLMGTSDMDPSKAKAVFDGATLKLAQMLQVQRRK